MIEDNSAFAYKNKAKSAFGSFLTSLISLLHSNPISVVPGS